MRSVSTGFLAALRGSHGQLTRVRALSSYQSGTDPTGTELAVNDGAVKASARAEIRSSCDLTIVARWPALTTDLLTPYGNELYIERGLAFGNGTTEMVGLGYFRIDSVEESNYPVGALRLTGSDRMAGIRDARLTAPRQFLPGVTVGSIVTSLVTEVYPSATIEWDDTTDGTVLARQQVVDRDRYAFLDQLVAAYGKIMYWDHRGVLVVKTPPDPTVPVWDVDSGSDGVMVSLSREISRDGIYNAVVALGEGADTTAPVRALSVDNDPNSATYWFGRFGQVPYFFHSPLITTTGQAASASQTLLRRVLGRPHSLSLGMIPNVALEPYDPVRVRTRDAARIHVLDELEYPLSVPRPMTALSRAQVDTTISEI